MASGLLTYAFIRLYIGEYASNEVITSLGSFGQIRYNTWWDGMFTTCTSLLVALTVSFITYKGDPVDHSLLLRKAGPDE